MGSQDKKDSGYLGSLPAALAHGAEPESAPRRDPRPFSPTQRPHAGRIEPIKESHHEGISVPAYTPFRIQ